MDPTVLLAISVPMYRLDPVLSIICSILQLNAFVRILRDYIYVARKCGYHNVFLRFPNRGACRCSFFFLPNCLCTCSE